MPQKTFTRQQASFIAKIEYENGVIRVTNHPDKNGHTTVTVYDGTEELYNRFVSASSVGKFWHSEIKPLGGRKLT